MGAWIAAAQLLPGFVLDADSFLPSFSGFLDSRPCRPCFFHRRSNCFDATRTAAGSAAADLIVSYIPVRREARALRAFTWPRFHEISTGENHEISAFDCSTNHADSRDLDLIERRRLLRWGSLLPGRLLHDHPIIRAI